MFTKTAKTVIAFLMAAIFASGSAAVCLHGPDDEHVHGAVACGMSDHGQTAVSVNLPADGQEHADGHDHHFCACACHSPTEPTPLFTMTSQAVLPRQMTTCPIVLAITALPIPYRPPIAGA